MTTAKNIVEDRDTVLLMVKRIGVLLKFVQMTASLTLDGEEDGSGEGAIYRQEAEDAMDTVQSLISRARAALKQAVTGAA